MTCIDHRSAPILRFSSESFSKKKREAQEVLPQREAVLLLSHSNNSSSARSGVVNCPVVRLT